MDDAQIKAVIAAEAALRGAHATSREGNEAIQAALKGLEDLFAAANKAIPDGTQEPVATVYVGSATRDGFRVVWHQPFFDGEHKLYAANQASALPLPEGWIPVTERLPALDDEVLVYAPKDKWRPVAFDAWSERRECPVDFSTVSVVVGEGWREYEFEEVTHWMPLPKAPAAPLLQPEGGE